MARARNIKPAFFENDLLAELEPIERLAFIGLWTIVDFKGCGEYRPKKIKAMILPYDDCDMEKIMINLDKYGFIRMYSVQGDTYYKVTNFEKHQNPHKNEKEKGSDIPDYIPQPVEIKEEKEISGKIAINPDKNGTARADSLFLIPDSLILNPDIPKPEKIPYQLVADEYNKLFADIVGFGRLEKLTKQRISAIKKMWNFDTKNQDANKLTNNIDYWQRYFSHCSTIPFFQDNYPRDEKHKDWRPNFDFVMKEKTLIDIKEKRYK